MKIVFSRDGGNPILIADPDAGGNPLMMTIETSDGTFTIGSTAGLNILAGTPVQSSFIMVYGTLNSLNNALDGMVFKTPSPDAAMQITVNDLGQNQGVGGPQQSDKILMPDR